MKQGMAGVIVFPIALCVLLSGMGIGFLGISAGGLAIPDDIVTALTPHAPIRIDGDGDFTLANGVNNTGTGDGSVGNPWIIENLDINGTNNGTCIFVGNTTEHYIIRNCSLYSANSGIGNWNSNLGCHLYNSTNGTLFNNSISKNRGGVILEEGSANNILMNNTISSHLQDGIAIYYSDMNQITNNQISSSGRHAIELQLTAFNNISNNIMVNCSINMWGSLQQWNSHTIDSLNTVNSKPLYYWKNLTSGTIPTNAGQVILANCTNVVIENQNLSDGSVGIQIGFGGYNIIKNNTASSNNWWGINIYSSNVNTIDNNTIDSNKYNGIYVRSSFFTIINDNIVSSNEPHGMYIYGTTSTQITNNNIKSNDERGIYLWLADFGLIVNNTIDSNVLHGMYVDIDSDWNDIYHNRFYTNNINAYDESDTNSWDNGYPSSGNYWDDYAGVDVKHGPDQNLGGHDGIGDSPYSIPGVGNQDNYPLMQPWNGTNITIFPETTPPFALNWTPNGTAVAINTTFMIEWNETMNWTSVEEGLMYGHDMVNWFYSDSGNWTHDETTNTSIFTPDFLEWNVEYGVMINSSARDLVGNLLDQDGDGVPGEFPEDVLSWIFTTIDAPPTILSTSPQHLDIEVDPNTNIMIEFSETMNTTSVENAFTFSGGGENFNITDGNVTWGILDKIMTFDPSYALKNDTSYIFRIEGTVARDLNDNLLDANGDNITGDDMILGFTTWLEPPAPSVVYGIPADGSTMVNVDTHIQIKFDFRMNTTTVEEVFTVTDGTHVLDESDGGFTWSNDHDLMTYQPNEFLNYEEDYTVRLLGTAKSYVGIMMDNNGNDIGDGSPIDDFVFTFATSPEPPQVSSTYPENGASRVLVTLDHINIVFDSSMDNDTVENAIRITPHIPSNMTWDVSNKELTIRPTGPLLFYTDYTVTINGDVAKNEESVLLDGNGDGAYGDDYQFRFVTEGAPDIQAPTIFSIFPPHNMTDIPINIYIQVSFNESMNKTTVEKSFSMSNNTAFINGSFVWNSEGNTFRYYPSENLSINMTHVMTIGPHAADLAGNKIGISYTWTFITGMGVDESLDEPLEEFWYYVSIIFILLILSGILYTKNKFLTKELRKTKVYNKKLKRHMKKLDPDYQGTQEIKPEYDEPAGEGSGAEATEPEVGESEGAGEVEGSVEEASEVEKVDADADLEKE